jgi:ribosomal protein L37E
MNKYDLSILIPARNEYFLARTVEGVLKSIRGRTEVIVTLDGKWADPQIPDDPRVTILYLPESVGQRAATNQACRLSKAKYVMKMDAHCALDEGFDVKLMEKMQDDWTIVPMMRNLHVFDWVCPKCGARQYQGPSSEYKKCPDCGTERVKEIIWQAKESPRSTSFCFDQNLHFQYFGQFKSRPEGQGDLTPTMSLQGSCFLLTRRKYWELNICDEAAAGKSGWGQQGVEVALKTWLSGGQVMCLHTTWYAHMFRTQGGDFSFPYHLPHSDQEFARQFSQDLWLNDKWPQAVHKLEWLLEKFKPVPYWHDTKLVDPFELQKPGDPTKGIIFYTDNKVNHRIAHAVQKQLKNIGLPIVSASLKPMDKMGKNIYLPLERGYLTMFKQQLAALEASTSDIIFLCEHDVLYHPSHFKFIPPRRDVFYYNCNVWKVNAANGHGVKVDVAQQVSGLCAYRDTLIEEYKRRVKRVEEAGEFKRGWGFEPGTKSIERGGFSDLTAENWNSEFPNIDIRADHNLTHSRWTPEEFRNQVHTIGWTESDEFPGWGSTKYLDILASI